jgi:uncharacterized protein YcfJ
VAKAKEGFEKHKKDIGAASLGVLAGGIIGNAVGGHSKKKNTGLAGMFIGAAIGGIGAAALERHHEKEKQKRMGYNRDGYESY